MNIPAQLKAVSINTWITSSLALPLIFYAAWDHASATAWIFVLVSLAVMLAAIYFHKFLITAAVTAIYSVIGIAEFIVAPTDREMRIDCVLFVLFVAQTVQFICLHFFKELVEIAGEQNSIQKTLAEDYDKRHPSPQKPTPGMIGVHLETIEQAEIGRKAEI